MKPLLSILIGSTAFSLSAWADDAYPLSRRGGLGGNAWYSAGIPAGVPYVTTVYTTLSPGTTFAQINAAIAACPSNQVVMLNAGTYNLGGVINLTKDGVVLRGSINGAGIPTTILTNAEIRIQPSSFYLPNGGGGFPAVSVRDVVSGYTEGSTSITLSSAPGANFAPGAIFVMDQTDDGTLVTTDTQGGTYVRSGRSYCQALYCTNISGNTLSFTPPLLGTYWSAARAPQIYGWDSGYGATRKRTGLENVDVDRGSVPDEYWTLKWLAGYQCWIKNVRVHTIPLAASGLLYCVNSEFRHCTFRDASDIGSGCYGVAIEESTACRIEDNTFTNLSLAITEGSSVGCSISYNYGSPPYPYSLQSWFAEYVFPHGGHCHHNIYEGNWLDGPIQFDDVFSENNSDTGIVRNRLRGYSSGKTENTFCFSVGEPNGTGHGNHRNMTVLGNSLGTSGYHTSYGNGGLWYVSPYSTGTFITNNYNVVNNGIPAAENVGSNTMLDSYAYASKPVWFGSRGWPAYGPQNYNDNAYTNIPAGYRSFYGMDPGLDPHTPIIAFAPTTYNFGTVKTDSSQHIAFIVRNVGGGTLAGIVSLSSGPFSIRGSGSYSLGPGQTQAVWIDYTPTVAGSTSQTLTFTGGGGGTASVSGTATP